MRITIGEHNCLHTTLYIKPNTKNQLLLLSSAHPPSVTRSSAYSLFLRLKGICSDEEAFTEEAEKLPSKLEARRKKTSGWWRCRWSHPESMGPGESGAVRDQRDKAAQAGLQLRPLLASSPARSHGRQLWGSMHQGFQACQNQLLGGLKH